MQCKNTKINKVKVNYIKINIIIINYKHKSYFRGITLHYTSTGVLY